MKKVLSLIIALIITSGAFAQLIKNKTDDRITLGVDLFTDFQLKTNDNWVPRKFNQGVGTWITYNFPLGRKSKHQVSLGVGMSSHNYYSKSRIDNPYKSELTFTQYSDSSDFKRFKINPTYIEIPLEMRFRIKDAVKIGIGFKFGIKVGAKTKYVGLDEEGTLIHEKYTRINKDILERYAYTATFRIGYKWVTAYVAFQMNRVFSEASGGPVVMPLSVGLSLSPF
jgi:hypothetical protein